MNQQLHILWQTLYPHQKTPRTFFSPGRVNLMGEHIDYNGGVVFPMALSLGTYGWIALREDTMIQLYSANFESQGTRLFDLNHLEYQVEDGWMNYIKGVVKAFQDKGHPFPQGFDLLLYGDLPHSSGLSSSASVEVLIATMMNTIWQLGYSPVELALLCQQVENHYIGVNCGIMDQFVIACAKRDHALLLNTTTLEYQHIPFLLADDQVVIINSKMKRGLVDSEYNQRREDCVKALTELQQEFSIHALCDLSTSAFTARKTVLTPVVLKRARHAISENERTLEAAKCLQSHDLLAFGRLMTQTHESLRDDFQVSIPALDFIVDVAIQAGATGARMTGAGFGGCVVAIVPKVKVDSLIQTVTTQYLERFQLRCECYLASPQDGAKEMFL